MQCNHQTNRTRGTSIGCAKHSCKPSSKLFQSIASASFTIAWRGETTSRSNGWINTPVPLLYLRFLSSLFSSSHCSNWYINRINAAAQIGLEKEEREKESTFPQKMVPFRIRLLHNRPIYHTAEAFSLIFKHLNTFSWPPHLARNMIQEKKQLIRHLPFQQQSVWGRYIFHIYFRFRQKFRSKKTGFSRRNVFMSRFFWNSAL